MRSRLARPALLAAMTLVACTSELPAPPAPQTVCADADGDGYDGCIECDDANAAVNPGAAETCNGRDDNCDARVDEGCACRDDEPPRACGAAGGGCTQACSNGQLGACQPPGGPVDTATDPAHCGECGHACPAPAHAAARCTAGVCGRGPCEEGFFDLDGATTWGCEASCTGARCTKGDGSTVDLASPPVAETGARFQTFVASSSLGAGVQTTETHTHIGAVGEAILGVTRMSNDTHKHVGGFVSAAGGK